MRSNQNVEDNSSHSTDSEQNGNTASESSSSLGDSATAAARVLAAWQDRTGTPGSLSAATAMAAAAAAISGPASEGGVPSGPWPHVTHLAAGEKLQSSMSTPRVGHGSFGYQGREGSAPVPGFSDANQRRPDMGFLALLNSAAAFVAESSDTTPGPESQERSQRQQKQHQQHQNMSSSYMAHGDLLNNPGLTLSGINSRFNRAGTGSDDGHSGYNSHYSNQLTNSDYQKLAQALQHIAATTTGTDGGILSS
ncbi:hypothetical protein GGI05_002751, partial [Coemansia sp. RSA 2603]